jgi:energy-coupling factor transporter ATP-binding protein EcfA2
MGKQVYISFIGPKGSGKNTCSSVLDGLIKSSYKELKFQDLMFAKKIKDVASKTLGLPGSFFEARDLKDMPFKDFGHLSALTPSGLVYTEDILKRVALEFGIEYDGPKRMDKHLDKEIESPRQFLKLVATEFLREYDPDIHTKKALELVEDTSDIVSFTDLRFLSEFNAVKRAGGVKVIFAWVDNEVAMESLEKDIKNGVAHESESGVLDLRVLCSYTIDNNNPGHGNLEKQIKELGLLSEIIELNNNNYQAIG